MSDREPQARPPPRREPWHRRPGPVALLIFAVIVIAIAGTLLWRHLRAYERTDDAFIDVISETVSPQVAGRVLRVLVHQNQDVRAGQLLVELDPATYLVALRQAQASVRQAQAQLTEARAQQTVYAAQLAETEASLGTAEASEADARSQLERYRRLRAENAGAVSAQQWDAALAADRTAAAQLLAGRKGVVAARAQQGYAASLTSVAQAAIAGAQAQQGGARLNLSRTRIRARLTGRIASKTVAEGNYVQVGTPLMAVVPREVYITANFKETQLARMRPGQPVSVSIDAYPDMKLPAHVDSIQPATGQALSLLPAENATGNWVKVVQRVPVKIVFDRLPDDPVRRLAPGMSVEVSVRVR
ncbi:MAG: HlyD family secretion protein [Opitutaceae bacterium]